ncbi:MAG: Gfo/Idh/MocA family oxidoreductase [Actinocatenispora sp.]
MRPLRVAVIGLGLMGRRHAAVLAAHPAAELVAGVDLSEPAREAFRAEFSVPAVASLSTVDADAVVVALPDNAHRAVAVDAIEGGLHVLVEKPLATTVADARAIVDAAAGSGAVVMVGQTLRFEPRYRQAHATVRSGRVGEVALCYARRNSAFGAAVRYGTSTSLPWHVSVHDVDVATWITGLRVVEVTARGTDRRLGGNGHLDALGALLTLEGGVPLLLESSWVLPEHLRSGIDCRLEVVGSRGSVEVHGLDEGLRVLDDDGWEHPDVLRWQQDGGAGPSGALANEVGHFVGAALGTFPCEVGAVEALHSVQVVAAIEESLRTGGAVPVV